jgi:hypothetical protein
MRKISGFTGLVATLGLAACAHTVDRRAINESLLDQIAILSSGQECLALREEVNALFLAAGLKSTMSSKCSDETYYGDGKPGNLLRVTSDLDGDCRRAPEGDDTKVLFEIDENNRLVLACTGEKVNWGGLGK